jgi:ferrous iron transport protein B
MSPVVSSKPFTVALAGNPNCGKTTLFNVLTGLRQKVGNYPGITVEKKVGTAFVGDVEVTLVDLPGTYSLSPRSEDARVTAEVLSGTSPFAPPLDAALCVVDGNTLERSLPLVLQVRALHRRMALLINMADELKKIGTEIDVNELGRRLGIPVFFISARTRVGVSDVTRWLSDQAKGGLSSAVVGSFPPEAPLTTEALRRESKILAQAVVRTSRSIHAFSARIDKVVMHKVAGPLLFAGVVLLVFQSIFSWAGPLMDWVDGIFGQLGEWAGGLIPPGFLNSLVVDGIIAGVGGVVIFLPQILIVFFFISLMENSGYLARAAIVMDRFFSKIGLQGKSFLPFISSYACAIPGIMAARTIENRRERLATIFVAPFMTCSARLPVYALLIGAFVPPVAVVKGVIGLQALALLSLYAVGFVAAVLTAWAFNSTVMKTEKMPFHMEVPPYRWPSVRGTFLMLWDRSKVFLRQAGSVILLVNIALWFLASYPTSDGPEPVKESYAGQIGVMIEPLIEPLGFNWKIGVGLIGSQAAREVIVSSLSTIYSIESADDDASLKAALRQDLTPLAAMSLLVFFALAMQCMATTAVVRRETGGWKIPVIQFFYMNSLAYVAALVVFQGGRLLGFQ